MQVKEIKEKQQKWLDEKKALNERGRSGKSSERLSASSRESPSDLINRSVHSDRVEKWVQQTTSAYSTPEAKTSSYQPGTSISVVIYVEFSCSCALF